MAQLIIITSKKVFALNDEAVIADKLRENFKNIEKKISEKIFSKKFDNYL